MKTIGITLTAAALAMTLGAGAQEIEGRFRMIAVGETKAGTLAIMRREPDIATASQAFGLVYERLAWREGNRTFVVKFIGTRGIESRSIGTRVCIGVAEC